MKRSMLILMASLSILITVSFSACASYQMKGVNRIRSVPVYQENLPIALEGYRIAFVSDIHFGNNFTAERLAALIDSVNECQPDCILLGGDLVFGIENLKEFALLISGFHAPDGIYAVPGNHDYITGRRGFSESLREQGIVVLDESAVYLPRGLVIAGINDLRDIFPETDKLHDLLIKDAFTVLISHNPDFAEKTDLSAFDLMLSGHTHGGQITIFGWAPVIPSEYGQKYRTGTVYKDGTPVLISNGAGYSRPYLQFRLFAPSDFLLISLHATVPR